MPQSNSINTDQLKITVIGAGYVGLTLACIMSAIGYTTYLLDIDVEKINDIAHGMPPFYEDGLAELLDFGLDQKTLFPTTSYQEAISNSNVIFSCVNTPDNDDGSSNLDFVRQAAQEASQYIQSSAIYVQKSTVPVGTGRAIRKIVANSANVVSYISNPEFLREGTSIIDSLWFDRAVVGGNDHAALEMILGLIKQTVDKRAYIVKAAGLTTPDQDNSPRYISTTLESAELIKVTANAFLSVKISFANSIALLADKVNADIVEIMKAVGADHRIGSAFLEAGRGYGGGCFPKDVAGLISAARDYDINLELIEAAQNVNKLMPKFVSLQLERMLDEPSDNKTVTVLGITFKPGTSDIRKSPGIKIANLIRSSGYKVKVYDPKAPIKLPELGSEIERSTTLRDAIKGSDAVVIATAWPEFMSLDSADYIGLMKGNIFIDAVNCFDPAKTIVAGLKYWGVGRNTEELV